MKTLFLILILLLSLVTIGQIVPTGSAELQFTENYTGENRGIWIRYNYDWSDSSVTIVDLNSCVRNINFPVWKYRIAVIEATNIKYRSPMFDFSSKVPPVSIPVSGPFSVLVFYRNKTEYGITEDWWDNIQYPKYVQLSYDGINWVTVGNASINILTK